MLSYRIGGGSFGEVWLAEDQAIGHQYAIKILKQGTPIHQRLREAHIGHVLDHNNVVRVHQADVTRLGQQDYVIIAMDYMPKGPVTRLANPSLYLPLPKVLKFGKDILRGLEYLHSHGFIHNDVKPENVLIGPQGQGMLTDYGIVGVTQDGAPVPPPTFYKIHAAPEVITDNSITSQTDVFQTGLTLFRMLIGLDTLQHRFDDLGESGYYCALAKDDFISASDFPAYVPSQLRRIVQKAVHPNLSERYSSALEMRRALEKLHYPGYWTVEANGDFVGYNGACVYRFEQMKQVENRYNVVTLRRRSSTGRETRFTKYCMSGVSNSRAKKGIARFVKAVVEGV